MSHVCDRPEAHSEHYHGYARLCAGRAAEPSWFVVWKMRQSDRPSLAGPFPTEQDANAYVSFRFDDGVLQWVVQNEVPDA